MTPDDEQHGADVPPQGYRIVDWTTWEPDVKGRKGERYTKRLPFLRGPLFGPRKGTKYRKLVQAAEQSQTRLSTALGVFWELVQYAGWPSNADLRDGRVLNEQEKLASAADIAFMGLFRPEEVEEALPNLIRAGWVEVICDRSQPVASGRNRGALTETETEREVEVKPESETEGVAGRAPRMQGRGEDRRGLIDRTWKGLAATLKTDPRTDQGRKDAGALLDICRELLTEPTPDPRHPTPVQLSDHLLADACEKADAPDLRNRVAAFVAHAKAAHGYRPRKQRRDAG
jgi:hypothetical protein